MRFDFTSDINKDYGTAMNYPRVDRFIVHVGWWLFAALALLTFTNSVIKIVNYYPSPFSWRVINTPEAFAVIVFGILAALMPTLLRGKIANHYVWRMLVTFTLTIFAYLFVFVSGGSIETHFLFFSITALVAIYSDWRLGWIMFVLVALHHGILNYAEPTWVYFYGRNDFALIAHALPVAMTVIFTTILCENNRKSIRELAEAKGGLETTVNERTRELRELTRELEERNTKLTTEVGNRKQAEEELRQTNREFERVNEDLFKKNEELNKLSAELKI